MARIKPSYPRLQREHPQARGLIGSWMFYEGAGTVYDLSGNGRHAIPTAGNTSLPEWQATPQGPGVTIFGNSNSSSNPGRYNLPLVSVSPPYTLGWIGNFTGSAGAVMGNFNSSALYYELGGSINLLGVTSWSWWEQPSGMLGGGWRLYLIVVSSSSSVLYANGIVGQTKSATGNLSFRQFGARGDGWQSPPSQGLAGVWLYDRALSSVEIADIYADPWELYRPPKRAWLVTAASTYTPSGGISSGGTASVSVQQQVTVSGGVVAFGSSEHGLSYNVVPIAAGLFGGCTAIVSTAYGPAAILTGVLLAGVAVIEDIFTASGGTIAGGSAMPHAIFSVNSEGGVKANGAANKRFRISRLTHRRFRIGDTVYVPSPVFGTYRYLRQGVRGVCSSNGSDVYDVGLGWYPDRMILSHEQYLAWRRRAKR